jgi:UPF0755 protein
LVQLKSPQKKSSPKSSPPQSSSQIIEDTATNEKNRSPDPFSPPYKKWVIGGIIIIVITLIGGMVYWRDYNNDLSPRDPSNTLRHRVIVKDGETIAQIAAKLERQQLIRSHDAFQQYIRLERPRTTLKTGCYSFTPGNSVASIVEKLSKGDTAACFVTITPGRTLKQITEDLTAYEYSQQDIKAALTKSYSTPLLKDKPKNMDLEGYLYPETFDMQADTDPAKLFQRSMDTLYTKLQKDNLIEKFSTRKLTIHQALTMASIIQKEASDPTDQKQIAQVFFSRLDKGMKLETDPTFIYAAEKLGVPPSVSVDSPYNTRKYPGLPPGPIGNMNYSALEAVAYPASGDFLYFVAGDDGTTHFSHTLQEHEAATAKYCKKNCQLF